MSMLRTLCAEGHAGPITFLHYAPDPERAIYRDELERIAAAHPNVRLVRSYTRAPGAGEVDGHFSLAQLAAVEPDYAQAETFACGPPALLDAVRETWAAAGLELAAARRELRAADARAAERRRRGLDPLRRLRTCGSRTAAPRCSSRPRRPGSAPSPAAGWASATPARCRKTAGTVKNLSTGEVSSNEDEEIQICVSAPIGDVVVEL